MFPFSLAQQKGLYAIYGSMLAYFLIHRGPTPCFFSAELYEQLTAGLENCVETRFIADEDLRHQVEKVECLYLWYYSLGIIAQVEHVEQWIRKLFFRWNLYSN